MVLYPLNYKIRVFPKPVKILRYRKKNLRMFNLRALFICYPFRISRGGNFHNVGPSVKSVLYSCKFRRKPSELLNKASCIVLSSLIQPRNDILSRERCAGVLLYRRWICLYLLLNGLLRWMTLIGAKQRPPKIFFSYSWPYNIQIKREEKFQPNNIYKIKDVQYKKILNC